MIAPFPHLRVASGYSLRHGASHPVDLVSRAAEQGMDTLGLTDRDGVYGAVRFVKACLTAGVRPVLGCDLAVHPSGLLDARTGRPGTAAATGRAARRAPARGGVEVDRRLPRVTVLATGGRVGWKALCRLVSAAHAAGRGQPVLTPDVIGRHAAEGALVVMLGPDSEVGRALARRRPDLARVLLESWRGVLGALSLVLEAVDHRARGEGPVPGTTAHASHTVGLAHHSGTPVVLTNQVRYADPALAPVVDVLDAARRLVPLDPRHLDRANAEGYLKSTLQMAEIATDVAAGAGLGPRGAADLLAATRALAERCLIDPAADLGLGELHFPELDASRSGPAGVSLPAGGTITSTSAGGGPASPEVRDPEALLVARCHAGLDWRYGAAPAAAVLDRLRAELDMIRRLGYPSYFLTVAEVCDMIRAGGSRVAARGSGAGSLVCYLLGISGVDPVRHGLLMERFLSPLRKALPDIDIDVESARRLEIYQQIFDRFGSDRVACVAMLDTYRVRHAIRDVGAAIGLPPGEVDAFAKAFPHIRARDVRSALADLPELRGSGISQALQGERLELVLSLVERLDGLPRHVALHPCGVLLSDLSLLDRTPVEPSFLGFQMSQFDKDDVEDLGLLKLDVLGVRMQSAMSHAVSEVQRVEGTTLDLDDTTCVPHDDPETFALVQSAKTLGCFQIESPGQRELVGKFAPETFGDIVIDISLFRPGPVKSDMVTPFLMARQGWREPEYLHPDLEPALAETCGVVVFHEQVLQVVATFTGCSLAEADEARRAMGDLQGKERVREWFRPRALARGYPPAVVDRVSEVLMSFASFGFCKAHAAAFALTTYQSAWLKTHHTAAFLAGVLTHDPGMYPKRLILDEARNFGVPVLPLDVNASDVVYRVEPTQGRLGIRMSLADVHGMAEAEAQQVVQHRPYTSLTDFWGRAQVSRPVVERLVLTGAFDLLYSSPRHEELQTQESHALESHALESHAQEHEQRITRRDLLLHLTDLARVPAQESGQLALGLPVSGSDRPRPSGLPDLDAAERCRAELDILGMDVSKHVLDFYEPFLHALGITRSAELLRRRSQSQLLVAGAKVATQTPPVRSGRRVVFLTLDDSTGPVDCTFFDSAQEGSASTVFHSWLLVVRGQLRRTGPRGVSLRASACWELGGLHEAWQAAGGADAGEVALAAVHRVMGEPVVDAGPVEGRTARDQTEAEGSPGQDGAPATSDDQRGRPVPEERKRRVLVHPSGFRQSPYADVRPAGGSVGNAPRRLWHASPGSAGP